MTLPFTAHRRFDVFKLQGAITIAQLATLAPQLSEHITNHPQQNIVIDFSEVSSIDANALRLFTNISKRLGSLKKKLYLQNPTEKLLTMFKTVDLNEIISDTHELEKEMNADLHTMLLPCTCEENGMNRLCCSCAVCGSKNVVGYLLDYNSLHWSWEPDALFPLCADSNGKEFDYFAALPILCIDCCMTSLDVTHFNIFTTNGEVIHQSTLSENARFHLTKNIKKRKKIIESGLGDINETLFLHERNRKSTYFLFLLADSSMKTIALNKADANPFMVGYLYYLTLNYSETDQKMELVDGCRTWLTQALLENRIHTDIERAQAYFILFAAALSLGKAKEASVLMHDFTKMVETNSDTQEAHSDLNSPLFWHDQTIAMWNKEISRKSTALTQNNHHN